MYMLVLTFIYMSALISVKCDVTRSDPKQKATQMKGELLKSLRHVGHFLAAVENKIKDERQILKDMADRNFPYRLPAKADKRRDFVDYGATDINWWNKRPEYVPKQKMKGYNPTTPYVIDQNDPPDNMYRDVEPKMREVLGHWVQVGNTRRNVDFKNTVDTPQNSYNNNEDLNPFLKEAVNKWIRNEPEEQPQDVTPEQMLTPIMTVKAAEFKPRQMMIYQNDEPTEDPFGIEFEYGQTTVGFDIFSTTKHGIQSNVTLSGPAEGGTTPMPTSDKFLKDLKDQMVHRKVGYFTVFTTKFFEILQSMSDEALDSFFAAFRGYVVYMNSEHMLDILGEPAITSLLTIADNIILTPGNRTRNYADSLLFVMVNKEIYFDETLDGALKAADNLYDDTEGEQLWVSLEYLSIFANQYPEGNRSALVVTEEMSTAILAPLERLAGTKQRRQFIAALNKLLTEKLPGASRRMQVVNKGVKGSRQLHRNTTKSNLKASQQHNFRRKTKHKRTRHHKTMKRHRKHHRNHKKTKNIRHTGFKYKKKQHSFTPAATTADTHRHIMLRATYDNNFNNIFVRHTTLRYNRNRMQQKRFRVKEDNPVRFSLHKFRMINKTMADRLQELKSNDSNVISNHPRAETDKTLLQKIIEDSSYSDEENDLKVKLYRAFDTM